MPEVVLIGYYGRGNFGDDVLMTVTFRIARQLMPRAKIGMRLPPDPTYMERIVGDDFVRMPFGTRDCHRVIIHGGGGTFFDFERRDLIDRVTNSALLAGGVSTYLRAERTLRCLTRRRRMSGQTRIGLGIGIGTFTFGSPKLREALPILADFDALWVRDRSSEANLTALGLAPPVVIGSDLAFLWQHWCPASLTLCPREVRSVRPRVGVILRDWPPRSGAALAYKYRQILETLSSRFDLTVISFDPSTDRNTVSALSEFPQVHWQPDKSDIAKFMANLACQDVLLTARAHGAICGACVGRPSVILNIEPKLEAVHAMLPEATRLIPVDTDAIELGSWIDEASGISHACIAADVSRNRDQSSQALNAILSHVDL